ncbi:MAG: PLP-dependent aminotransferase family protein [Parvibaculaceae bacterium]
MKNSTWEPEIPDGREPLYLRLAAAFDRDIRSGVLPPGAQLPTHRELSDRLGISLGTVTRAYAEVERNNLVGGQKGRGTYVIGAAKAQPSKPHGGIFDLSRNVPPPVLTAESLGKMFHYLQREPDIRSYLDYVPHGGVEAHRATISQWLARRGVPADRDNLLLTNGAQHAVCLVMEVALGQGAAMACENFTYYGLKSLAQELERPLQPIEMDEEGMRPDALDQACRERRIAAIYIMPTLQTPTARIMSETRRRDLAKVCRAHDLVIIEDDVYGFLAPDAPSPMASIAPERTFYVSSISKCIAPGLRIGFVVSPADHVTRLQRRLGVTCWMASPLLTHIASELVREGIVDHVTDRLRKEARHRMSVAMSLLPGLQAPSCDSSFHVWIPMKSAEAEAVIRRATARQVLLTPADAFTVGNRSDGGIRICLGSIPGLPGLERGLFELSEAMNGESEFLSIV